MAACERCGRQLSKVKHHRPHGVGRACAPRCKEVKRSLDAEKAQLPAAHKPKKQRTASDPGEQRTQQKQQYQSRMQPTTRRILPPTPIQQTLPRSMRSTEKIARQLEETHARRMAAMAAEAWSAAPPAQE